MKDELRARRRRIALDRWASQWRIEFRVWCPPTRFARVIASIVAGATVCGPALAIWALAVIMHAPGWVETVAIVPLIATPFVWLTGRGVDAQVNPPHGRPEDDIDGAA